MPVHIPALRVETKAKAMLPRLTNYVYLQCPNVEGGYTGSVVTLC